LYLLSGSSANTPAKSLWTEELETALMKGEVDMIVHSLKDVPTQLPEECEIGAILEREDPRDALIVKQGLPYKSLEEMPEGSVIGTSSVRRIAQLRKTYPGLKVMDVRGNLDTRFRKLDDPTGPYTALLLASAGVTRMKMTSRITALLSSESSKGGMFYAVGQGAIAIEIRAQDDRVKNVLRGAGHWESEWRVGAERALLRELEGGCSVPVGVETVLKEVTIQESELSSLRSPFEDKSAFKPVNESSPLIHHSGAGHTASIDLSVCVTSMDGAEQVIHRPGPVLISSFQEAQAWGKRVAVEIKRLGAEKILAEINAIRREREAESAKVGREIPDPDGHAIPA